MYQGFIVRVNNIRKHMNADRLQVVTIFGSDVVVGLDVKEGDIGCYFPTDGKLGLEYCVKNNLLIKKDENGINIGGYLDENKRKIGTLKLRGEKSDGLYLPINSLSDFTDISKLKVGDTFTEFNGITICEKYVVVKKENNRSNNVAKKEPKLKENFPFFKEHIDTSQYAYNKHAFKEGDLCYITLKLHGTSGRTGNSIKVTNKKVNKFLYPILKRFNLLPKPKTEWENITGTRRVVLFNKKDEYYKDDFRDKWHNFFKDKLHKGETVYYEIVGYTNDGKLIMASADNHKTKDKEFIKQYGDKTNFTYGCNEKESDMYVYRITMTNEDGVTIEYPQELIKLRAEQLGAKVVPQLDKFIYTTEEDLQSRVDKFTDGIDLIGKNHIREGIVIRIDGKDKFTAYKNKSFNFKVLEDIIKLSDVEDLEENS